MIGVGGLSVLLMIWTVWVWAKKKVTTERISGQKRLLYAWMAAVPLNYAAMEAGWVTREVGRQPWAAYGVIRTAESASTLPAATAGASLFVFAFVYLAPSVAFLLFAAVIIKKGPEYKGPEASQ
jgi:cytochrome d ubiquinol oxidase subunit I